MSKLANRRSPSGPKSTVQLPYFNTSAPVVLATQFVGLGAAVTSSAAETVTEYAVPANGKLDTLSIQNGPDAAGVAATSTQVATYQARKNGVNVGSPVLIAGTTPGPVSVDLSAIIVAAGDRVSISVTFPAALAGTAPVARVYFSWQPSTSN